MDRARIAAQGNARSEAVFSTTEIAGSGPDKTPESAGEAVSKLVPVVSSSREVVSRITRSEARELVRTGAARWWDSCRAVLVAPSNSPASRPALGVADMDALAGTRPLSPERAARIREWGRR